MPRSLEFLDLRSNGIGLDGFNELLKFMELPTNSLKEIEMRHNPGYEEIMDRYKEVRVLELICRIHYTNFMKSCIFC